MSIVYDYIECPQCGAANQTSELCTDTGAQSFFCTHCGHTQQLAVVQREDGQPPKFDLKSAFGIGTYCIHYVGDVGDWIGAFIELPKDLDDLKQHVEQSRDTIVSAKYTTVNDDMSVTEHILV